MAIKVPDARDTTLSSRLCIGYRVLPSYRPDSWAEYQNVKLLSMQRNKENKIHVGHTNVNQEKLLTNRCSRLKCRIEYHGVARAYSSGLAIEKLIRKAYRSNSALGDDMLVPPFVIGFRHLEVRAAVRLGRHKSLLDAFAHPLKENHSHRVREVVAISASDRPQNFTSKCFAWGEKDHL
ncbi:unnamed protein product [Diatraea saccharalis]|uniref:Uncharacterized protein n=1 Tax=Diatraea saccharalis TaxID=40085 RepID=A0A9N9RBY7_9NEOP|nr:unnamed protein product [Diatraea saccharalis]